MSSWLFRHSPMGMNARNYALRQMNSRPALRLAKNKAAFKRLLQEHGIPTPTVYQEVHDFTDLRLLDSFPDVFVVKPSRGSGGSGIILLERKEGLFVNPSGDRYTERDLRRHIRRILDGEYSAYVDSDSAIVEERIYPSKKLEFRDAYGLPDIRVFCYEFVPVMAMLRYPTFQSKGRANLAAGGIGVGIDLETGRPTYVHTKKGLAEFRPSDVGIPENFVMPGFVEMKELAVRCSALVDLRISGADLILNSNDAVMVLEVNGRPGLEIQNVSELSLLDRFKLATPVTPG